LDVHQGYASSKPYYRKTRWEKILVKEKEYNILCVIICLVKNLTRKTQCDKTMVKGKRVQNTFLSPPHKDNYILDEDV